MNPKPDAQRPKPRLALAIATALGAGYLPKAPGTFGSLVGVFLTTLALGASTIFTRTSEWNLRFYSRAAFLSYQGGLILLASLAGLWAADRAAIYFRQKDPQIVVIDEVSGQLIAYFGLATAATFALNWQYLLAGFILFRVFDIWKPFPIRRAESLPGGLGIMADDWIAGLYAALVLALARHLGF
jgi:phosphatidylglycerophosphatase A